MARRRYQNPKPKKENGMWIIRVREDALDEDGRAHRVRPRHYLGPAAGPDAISLKEAQQIANETVLKQLNRYVQQPGSIIKLSAFIAQRFIPEWVEHKKCAGRQHYGYCLKKIEHTLGEIRLRDLKTADVRKLCAVLEQGEKAGKNRKAQKPLSAKSVGHVKTTLTTVINYAKQEGYFSGDNPAELVRVTKGQPKERYAYSFEQAQIVLAELPSPVSEAVFTSMTTSLNVAELCGLRIKRLNLTPETIFSAGEAIPPYSALVRENYYRNTWGTVKTGKRYRTVAIPDYVVEKLTALLAHSPYKKPDDPVFASKTGTPIDAHNVNNRIFKKISEKLKIPVTWHIFRHSAATFLEALNMPLADREKMMGHANAQMTMHYTHSDVERRRKHQNLLAERILPQREKDIRRLMDASAKGPKQ